MISPARALALVLLAACAGAVAQERAPAAQPERPTLRERLAARAARQEVPGRIERPGTYDFKLVHAGQNRLYRVHVPRSWSPSRPATAVFAFHGGGGSAAIMADNRFYGLIAHAEQAGYVAVFPNGSSRFRDGKLATWNAGNCCGRARDERVDDVGFVRALVAELHRKLDIDADRLFAIGMSNGGMMSYRLACEAADLFRGIAAVAGTDGMAGCTPARPISVLHIHARDDERVLFGGGAGKDSVAMADFRSVDDTIVRWVQLNACGTSPRRVLDLPGQAFCEVYSGCRGGVEVKLCVTDSGGHSWPGGMTVRSRERGSTAISANEVFWEFFGRR